MNQTPEYTGSEKPAIDLLQSLGYHYLKGSELTERGAITEVVLTERLRTALRRVNPWINDINVERAITRITSVTGASLMEINQKIWELLLGTELSLKQEIDGREWFYPVAYIDYKNPENNEFLVVNQMHFHSKTKVVIPDIVIYVNGLPLAVIECKAPGAKGAWDTAYKDLEFYQENSEKLFHYNQILVALWSVGGKYGAIKAPQQFFSVYKTAKEETLPPSICTEQDKLIYCLFRKERLLDIIHHFVIFEVEEGRTIKKLPRYQQLRATNKTIARLQEGRGGVVWHTQGSGKSITMAYVARKLQAQENGFENPTVIVMTDRKDLDQQITNTFHNVGFKDISQANSVANLEALLRNDYGGIITTTLQKFQESDKEKTESTDRTKEDEKKEEPQVEGTTHVEKQLDGSRLTRITKVLDNGQWIETQREEIELEELSKKENLYVLVDEAHRSQYGFLAAFMRTVLPKAKFVAFTGTPISKEDKSTLAEFYGGHYIDVYTIKEAVADGATVELLYDEGIARVDIKKEELDKEFDEKYGTLSEEKRDKLMKEALRKFRHSQERVEVIAKHLIDHYRDKIFPDKHKAMLVCSGRHAAIRYKKAFEALKEKGYHHFNTKVVVSLGSPKSDAIAKDYFQTLEWNRQNPKDQKPTWIVPTTDIETVTKDFKLPFGNEEETEKSGKKKYDNTALLIVSDMLLTGYDAPIASCLYLDKPLKEHNLLQAIARVNRSRKGKNAGYIMDYNGITANLIEALEIFSGDVRPDDILKNIKEEIPHLEANHAKLVAFFKPMGVNRKYLRQKYMEEAVLFIEPLDKRDSFKLLLKQFNKSINRVLPNVAAMRFEADFKLYNEIKLRARNSFPEDEELKVTHDESEMLQQLIDTHLTATGVDNLLQEPISIIDRERFQEEMLNASPHSKELKMRNNLKHTIKVGEGQNPDFYKPLAQRLEELLKKQREDRISQHELLLEYADIQDTIINKEKEGREKGFHTPMQLAVYDSMKTIFNGQAEQMTHELFEEFKDHLKMNEWHKKSKTTLFFENSITRRLKESLGGEARKKAKEIVGIMIKNKDA